MSFQHDYYRKVAQEEVRDFRVVAPICGEIRLQSVVAPLVQVRDSLLPVPSF